jgi:PAS domain S-box-containing protein
MKMKEPPAEGRTCASAELPGVSTEIILVLLTQSGEVAFINSMAENILGYKKEELVGTKWFETCVPAQIKTSAINLFQDIVTNNSTDTVSAKIPIITKTGEENLLAWRITAIKDITGGISVLYLGENTDRENLAEEELRKIEERYRVIMENIDDGYYETDLAGTMMFCNFKVLKEFGYTNNELVGLNYMEYMDEESAERVFKAFHGVFVTGLSANAIESDMIRKDGSGIPTEMSSSLLKDSNGNPKGFCGIIRDITKRKLAEKALRASEEKYRTILDSIDDGYYEMDLAGNIISFNKWIPVISGYTPEELIGMNFREYMNPEDAKTVFPIFHQVYLTGQQVSAATWGLIKKDGSQTPVETSISLVRDASGNVIGFRGIARDISQRKKAQEALRISEERYRALAENMHDVIWIIRDMRFTYLTPSIERQWGYQSDEIIGRPPEVILSPDSSNTLKSVLNEVIQSQGENTSALELPFELEVITKDGTKVWTEAKINVLYDASGKFTGFQGLSRDITERKNLENSLRKETEELKKARTDLEKAYTDLKATQAHILQQEKMASIGQLAAGVAHEINNPMGFISSNLVTLEKYLNKLNDYMLSQSDLLVHVEKEEALAALHDKRKSLKIDFITDDIKDLIQESLEGAERVKKIVQNLKSFSRVDQAEHKQADINECIESTINIVWNELKYKTTIVKEYGDIPVVMCCPQQLNQVFMNLLVNAAHAIETQGVITVRTWKGNGSVFASVSDTGSGIKPENLSRIFEPFFTTKDVGKGTGLGLSITYDIIKKHGGDLTVKSVLGEGTTFTVGIPLQEGSEA